MDKRNLRLVGKVYILICFRFLRVVRINMGVSVGEFEESNI